MSGKALISISWCASHRKGGDHPGALHIPAYEHCLWLEECVDHLAATTGLPIIVACTGFPGMIEVNNSPDSCERDVLWRVLAKTRAIVGVPYNPGHQIGAALCIRQALECASKFGYDYLIHTAEDVIPRKGTIPEMLRSLDEGYAYAGERWGAGMAFLNAQFFACRVEAIVGPWNACEVPAHGHIEGYLRDVMAGHAIRLLEHGTYYHTTHDHSEWTRGAAEERR